jgi:CBS domain-containing protein
LKTVADILNRKGSHVEKVSPGTPVIEALKIMAEKQIGSVVVMDGEKFLGIMTERDYSRKVVLKGRSSEDTKVADIMSSDYPSVTRADKVSFCMQLLSTNKLRYLPVVENNQLTGIISINDVVTATIMGQEEMISYLQNYIQS